jgi:hypothetical protein
LCPQGSFAQSHEGSGASGERILSSSTLYSSYDKNIPLVEGHGSFFDKAINLQDPLTKKEFEHDNAVLEIIDGMSSSAVLQCTNLAAEWGLDASKLQHSEAVCGTSDYLVRVWPTSKNQAKADACYCVSRETYRAKGKSPSDVKGYARPPKGQQLSLVPLTGKVNAWRPDGSFVSRDRLEGVYAQDLGPGPVDMGLGARMRNMRFFVKDKSGKFVPVNGNQDAIYQVLDSGLLSSDIPAAQLAGRGKLHRGDGTGVPLDRVSHDMWMRPRYIMDPSGTTLSGSVLQTNAAGEQVVLNSDRYTMPAEINGEDFGLMSRMRSPDRWRELESASLGKEISGTQTLMNSSFWDVEGAKPRPARSNSINTGLPRVGQYARAVNQTGYYTHTDTDNYVFARPQVIWNIQETARRLRGRGITMGIGDIGRGPDLSTKANGERRRPHDSDTYAYTPGHSGTSLHHRGQAVDMRMITKSGMAQGSMSPSSSNYDREKTWTMIKTMIEVDPQVVQFFFTDEVILERVRNLLARYGNTSASIAPAGHHDHIHIAWE